MSLFKVYVETLVGTTARVSDKIGECGMKDSDRLEKVLVWDDENSVE
jgi:hypothetical protein